MKKILVIINPVSGVGKQKYVEKALNKFIDKERIQYTIEYTNAPGHATEISRKAVKKFDAVIAVGGDGTINEVSQGLIESDTPLGIIPLGSGNGLARFLNIPLSIEKAIQVINGFRIKTIDTIRINDTKFVNVAGVGFDAIISHKFANSKKRGFISYLKLILNEISHYKGKKFKIWIDGVKIKKKAFLITFANSSQFGYNAHISPSSKIDDGIIEVCLLKSFPFFVAPSLTLRLFNRTLDKSVYSQIYKGKDIRVVHKKNIIAHIDGEPKEFGKELKIKMNPLSLKVIC